VFAFRVVENFDVFEHAPSRSLSGGMGFPCDPLTFQQLEVTLGNGVVLAIPATADAGFQIVLT
jgi:hypothetical protein